MVTASDYQKGLQQGNILKQHINNAKREIDQALRVVENIYRIDSTFMEDLDSGFLEDAMSDLQEYLDYMRYWENDMRSASQEVS